MAVETVSLRAPEGCVTHLLWDPASPEALAIDPRLDQVEDLLALARERGVRIRAVIDTHTHADHLSGARRLAARAGAELLAPEGSRIEAPVRRVAPGGSFALGGLQVRVLAAPGHTPDAVALLAGGRLYTGDALFIEGVGRTDFPGGSPDEALATLEAFEALPPGTIVHPGHDYRGLGSATLEELRRTHPVLSEAERARRRERVAGKGAVIPDIRHFLAWNLAREESGELPPLAVQALVRGRSARLVDVRSPAEFNVSRIAESQLLPLEDVEGRAASLLRDRELILVCRTGNRARTAQATLARAGIRAALLEGGVEAWRKAGLPLVESRPGVLPLDRQVQLGAGSMILAGVLLAALVSPWALVIPGFVGAGLIFAGASGTCGLARVLSLLPWNRAPLTCAVGPTPSCSAGGAPPASCSAGK